MYGWLHALRPFIEKEVSSDFFQFRANEDDLLEAEKKLNLKLPLSYKEFLKISQGTILLSLELFSLKEVLKLASVYDFKPWEGSLKFNNKIANFSNKPRHLLIFAQMGSISYCFDTSKLLDEEYTICAYEAENKIEETLKVYSKSFYSFVLEEIKALTDWWEMPGEWYTKESFFEKINTLLQRSGNN